MTNTVQIGWVLAQRELRARYRESILGLGWLVMLPLIMASLYTLVFWGVFQARWPAQATVAASGGMGDAFLFGLRLFAGLAVFQFFADVLVRSTRAITDNAPLVKRLRFPVLALVFSQVMSSFVALLVSLACCVLIAVSGFGVIPSVGMLVFSVLWSFVSALGIAMILASLATYLRDLQQLVPAITAALLFVSPVFYPSLKAQGILGQLVALNPLSAPIELVRAAVFSESLAVIGYSTDGIWAAWGFALMLLLAGFWTFHRLKGGFADLI